MRRRPVPGEVLLTRVVCYLPPHLLTQCNDGSCIELSYRCNRVADCYDRTDEIGCAATVDPYNRTNDTPACDPATSFQVQWAHAQLL